MLSAISVQVVIVAMWFLLSLRVEAELLRTGGSLQLETAESDYWFKCRYSEFTEPADQNKDCHQLQSKTVEFEVHLQDERLILQSQLIIIFTYFSQSTWQIRFSPFIYREGYFYRIHFHFQLTFHSCDCWQRFPDHLHANWIRNGKKGFHSKESNNSVQ